MKVGKTNNCIKRTEDYNTGSPFRDYERHAEFYFNDRSHAEKLSHLMLQRKAHRRGEWFQTTVARAVSVISLIHKRVDP